MDPGQSFVARVGSGQPSLVWVWKISLKNPKILNFFLFGLGLKVKYPGQSWVGLLFTAGQKYAWVESSWVRAHLYFDPRLPNTTKTPSHSVAMM